MLDLPGGFAQIGETSEEGVCREVMEETGLKVVSAQYLFSLPNVYRYSGIDIHTLDMFYLCEVEDDSALAAGDDAAECMWIKPEDIHTEQFGLRSVRWGLIKFLERQDRFKSAEEAQKLDFCNSVPYIIYAKASGIFFFLWAKVLRISSFIQKK